MFDMMPSNVEDLFEKDRLREPEIRAEDIRFVQDQRGERKMKIGKIDKQYVARAEASEIRRKRLQVSASSVQSSSPVDEISTSTSTSEVELSIDSDTSLPDKCEKSIHSELEEPEPSTSGAAIARETSLLSKKAHVSVRTQADILKQVTVSSGLKSKGLSKSNVHRISNEIVKGTAESAREAIRSKQGSNMFLQYDGKIVKEYTKGKKLIQDRLAISVKCGDESSLLGIPPCLDGIGECQTNNIIEVLEEYQLKEEIIGLTFDTTASNTGREKGVNTRINQYLGRPLLHLACRHHMYECHIKNVSKLFRTSCGPDHPLFKRLSEIFLNIEVDQNKLCKYVYDKDIELDNVARKTLTMMDKVLAEQQLPRGDYIELARLIQFYLTPPTNKAEALKIIQPGALHHARFMSQSIYYLKLKILENHTDIQARA